MAITESYDKVDALIDIFGNPGGPYLTNPPEALTLRERTSFVVFELEIQAGNGGFDQFLYNAIHSYPIYVVDALAEIGANHTANLMRKAIEVAFKSNPIPTDARERRTKLDEMADEDYEVLAELTNEYYDGPDDLPVLLYAYVVTHQAEIRNAAAILATREKAGGP